MSTTKKPAKKRGTAKSRAARPSAARQVPGSKDKKSAARKKKPPKSLGRPTVSNEDLLFMVFKEDYHARQIFEFLRVNTVKELEQFSADEIVRRLSEPVRISVERIRIRLAECNRCLPGDLDYALDYKSRHNT